VCYQSYWLDRRVQRQQVAFTVLLLRQCADRRVLPDICTISAELAQLDVIAVLRFSIPKHEHQFMAGSVERALPAVVLGPDTEIQERVVNFLARGKQLAHVPPILADEVHSTGFTMDSKDPKGFLEEC